VHEGFQKAANSVSGQVLGAVYGLLKDHKHAKVKTTGHSLGAALAQLTGMTLIKNGIEVDQMINFGMPRIGDKEYAEFSDATWPNTQWRMTHNKDIIPHSPPSEWPFSFHHTSTEVYEDKHGNYTICEKGEDPKCSNDHLVYGIFDHLTYMDKCMGELCGDCKDDSDVTFLQ